MAANGPRALGRLFNTAVAFAPTDAVAGAITGNRINVKRGETVTFDIVTSAGSTDLFSLDLQEHTAASGGTSRDLDVVTAYFTQSEATLDADEVWVAGTQSAASEITSVGVASEQLHISVEVGAEQLSDDCAWVSVNVPDLGSNGTKWCAGIAIVSSLHTQRKPASLATAN